jgi:uncharacterized protein YgiM (DUF1202 family)
VNISSVYLRSGPGTGYGAVGFGYAGDEFPVLAQHTSDLWLLVQADSGEVWVATSVGTLSGDCTDLPISDTPLRSESSSGSDSATATEVPPAAGDTASTPEDNSGHDGGEDSSHSGEGGGS